MLGLAVGNIGMSFDDFCQCSPSEFSAIATAWHKGQEQLNRQQWEQARMLCLCSLQPYTKDRMKPTDVMRFPWDGDCGDEDEKLSTKEIWERFGKVKEEMGTATRKAT